jgi:hypothetical protein
MVGLFIACYTVVTLLLHCFYTFVTLLLHFRYTFVTQLLHCFYTVVTLLLHCRDRDGGSLHRLHPLRPLLSSPFRGATIYSIKLVWLPLHSMPPLPPPPLPVFVFVLLFVLKLGS